MVLLHYEFTLVAETKFTLIHHHYITVIDLTQQQIDVLPHSYASCKSLCLKKKKSIKNNPSFFHSLPKQMHTLARSRSFHHEAVCSWRNYSFVHRGRQNRHRMKAPCSCFKFIWHHDKQPGAEPLMTKGVSKAGLF